MARPLQEVAKQQLAEVDKRPDWQMAVRELRQALVQVCAVLDDLTKRVEALEDETNASR